MAQSSFQGFLSPRPDKKGSVLNVKSIQSGSQSISSGTSIDITIAAVDITKSVVYLQPINASAGAQFIAFEGKLTTATNLNVSRGVTIGNTYTLRWMVVEYNNVKSLQTGELVVPGSSTAPNITISSVNLSKSIIVSSMKVDNGNAGNPETDFLVESYFVSSTSIHVEKNSNTYQTTYGWQVIEFY